MEIKEFTSERDRLEQAIASGDVTAFTPLADELNEQGHTYGEELCLCAYLICELDSKARIFNAITIFKTMQEQQAKTDEGDAAVSRLRELME